MASVQENTRAEQGSSRTSYTTWLQGLFIVALGSGLSYGGFKFGLNRSIERAKTDYDDGRALKIDPNKVGPSGVPAKNMALKAFARGSGVAFVIAGLAGFGMSFIVEAKHKGVSKEQEERELRELYDSLGIVEEMEKDAAETAVAERKVKDETTK